MNRAGGIFGGLSIVGGHPRFCRGTARYCFVLRNSSSISGSQVLHSLHARAVFLNPSPARLAEIHEHRSYREYSGGIVRKSPSLMNFSPLRNRKSCCLSSAPTETDHLLKTNSSLVPPTQFATISAPHPPHFRPLRIPRQIQGRLRAWTCGTKQRRSAPVRRPRRSLIFEANRAALSCSAPAPLPTSKLGPRAPIGRTQAQAGAAFPIAGVIRRPWCLSCGCRRDSQPKAIP